MSEPNRCGKILGQGHGDSAECGKPNYGTDNWQCADCARLELAKLKTENEVARMRIKELDLLFGRYIIAMRSAVIEDEHGKGPAAAMEWIYNSLVGPGQLPPEGETDSQAYFDRELVAVDKGMQEVMAFHDARRKHKSVKP